MEVCRESNPAFKFSDDVASLHLIKEKRKRLRDRLVTSGGVGPYPRALSATWDIHARKTLASIPTEAENGSIGVFDCREKIVNSDWIDNFKESLRSLRENKGRQIEQLTNFDVPCEPFFKIQSVEN